MEPVYFATFISASLSAITFIPLLLLGINSYLHSEHLYPNINCNSICSNADFYQLYTIIYAVIGVISNCFCISVIAAYVQRLILIFKGTLFELENKSKIMISLGIYIAVSFVSAAFTVWSTFSKHMLVRAITLVMLLLSFSIESGYICYVLIGRSANFVRFIRNQIFQQYKSKIAIQNGIENQSVPNRDSSTTSNIIIPATYQREIEKRLYKQAMPLFNQTRKLAVLSIITFVTTIIDMIGGGIIRVCIKQEQFHALLVGCGLCFDIAINFLCLTLQFNFFHKIYDKTFKVFEKLPLFAQLEASLTTQFFINSINENKIAIELKENTYVQ